MSDARRKILIIQNRANTEERMGLELRGHSLIRAQSAHRGIELLDSDSEIDLVLIDIDLEPARAAAETAKRILAKRDVPIVLLVSPDETDALGKAEHVTVYGYVAKDSGSAVLEASIETALRLFETQQSERRQLRRLVSAQAKPEKLVRDPSQENEELEQFRSEAMTALKSARESEARFARTFRTSPACQIITTFPGGVVVDVNEAYCRLLGYSREELIGSSTVELGIWSHAEDRDSAVAALEVDGRIAGREATFRTKSGELRTVVASVEPIVIGRMKCVISSAVDITDRILATRRLQESEADLAAAQRLAKIGSWRFISTTREVRWSDELYRVFEMEKSGFGNDYESFLGHIHPEDRDRVLQTNRNALESGEPFDLEYRILTPLGHVKHIHEVGYASREPNGTVTGLFGTAQDITDKKNAEEALLRLYERSETSAQRLDYALNSAGLGAWELDLLDHTAWRSLKHDRIFGYADLQSQWTFEKFRDHVQEEDRAQVIELFQKAISSGSEWDFECRIKRVDGETRWIWAKGNPRPDERGRLRRMFGIVQDITERKRQEEAARQSERFMTSVLDSMSEHIAIVDDHGTIVRVNRAWTRFAQKNGADMSRASVGTNYLDVCERTTGDSVPTATAIAQGIRSVVSRRGTGLALEYPCGSRNKERWFIARVMPLVGEGPAHAVVSHEEITDRHATEAELRMSEERYRKLVEDHTRCDLHQSAEPNSVRE